MGLLNDDFLSLQARTDTISPHTDLPCSLEAGVAGLVHLVLESSGPCGAFRIAFVLFLLITTPARCI